MNNNVQPYSADICSSLLYERKGYRHSLSHGCEEKTNPDVSNNYNVENSFLFSHLNPDLVVLHKNAVKPQQSSCKRPPFLRLSLNLKKVQHLEIINVPNHFLWLAVVFHMKELLWNTFSKSVFTFSFSYFLCRLLPYLRVRSKMGPLIFFCGKMFHFQNYHKDFVFSDVMIHYQYSSYDKLHIKTQFTNSNFN